MKFSKDLLELRDREAKLVRLKRYDEAERIKMKGNDVIKAQESSILWRNTTPWLSPFFRILRATET